MVSFEQIKRDPFLSEASFQEQMEIWPRSNFFDSDLCAMLADPQRDRNSRRRISWRRGHACLHYLMLRYSGGEPFESLRTQADLLFFELNRHFEEFPDDDDTLVLWHADPYNYTLQLMGLALLFNHSEILPKLAQFMSHKEDDGQDQLIARLFADLGVKNVPSGEGLIHPKAYQHLYDVVKGSPDEQKTREGAMKLYLKNWYKGMKKCGWHDMHVEAPRCHYGYWAFETGLVTLLYNLDDSSYRNMSFYPKDLVDYARAHHYPTRLKVPVTLPSVAEEAAAEEAQTAQ